MSDRDPSLRAARERTIDALCDGFARDTLSLPELERRLERARTARTRAELRALLSDVAPAPAAVVETGSDGPAGGPGTIAARPRAPDRVPTEPADATSVRTPRPTRPGDRAPAGSPAPRPARGSHLAFAVMGGTRRAGRWVPPETMVAVAIMGGVELDFRDAVLEPGVVVDINVFAFWGAVEITVPPDVHVDSHGFALLGGFEQTADAGSGTAVAPPADAPTVRVNGLAIMGGVEVTVKEREQPGHGTKKRS